MYEIKEDVIAIKNCVDKKNTANIKKLGFISNKLKTLINFFVKKDELVNSLFKI